jgi:hypothetical protein
LCGGRREPRFTAYPGSIDRNAVDAATGFKRSTSDAYIQRLQARQPLAKGGRPIGACPVLFDCRCGTGAVVV